MFDKNKRRPKGSVTAAVADRFQGLKPRSVGDEGSDGPDLRRGQVHSAAGDVGRDNREAGGAGTASRALASAWTPSMMPTTSPSIRPSSSTRTTSFDLRSAHRQRGRVGPGVLAHTDEHVVQRAMRA